MLGKQNTNPFFLEVDDVACLTTCTSTLLGDLLYANLTKCIVEVHLVLYVTSWFISMSRARIKLKSPKNIHTLSTGIVMLGNQRKSSRPLAVHGIIYL
jgi:hypothetical protein